MVDDLLKLGVGPNKSHTVKLPYLENEELERHMIRGIWDGDGSVLYRPCHTEYKDNLHPEVQICGNLNIVKSIANILVKKLKINDPSITPTSSIFLFRKVGNAAQTIVNYLYNDSSIYLNRKYEKALLCTAWVSKK